MISQPAANALEDVLIRALLESARLRELCLQTLAPRPAVVAAAEAGDAR